MKRLLIVVALLVAGAGAVDVLGDLTQLRRDPIVPGSRTELVLEIDARDYTLDVDQGARNLVAACAGTSGHNTIDQDAIEVVDKGTVRLTIEPAIGRNNRRKLVGCLEDATVDRLLGHVVSIESIPA